MKTILEKTTNEIIIKNSRFITILFPLESDNINNYLEDIKQEYPKATHYCYAYIYEDKKHSSDDGEPSSTAGLPMLNVLEKENLMNVLAITVRYFGGIKLGAGGLVRAYTKSLTNTLQNTKLKELIEGYRILIETDYSNGKQLDYILRESNIINKEFNEKIKYIVDISKENLEKLSIYNPTIIEEKYI